MLRIALSAFPISGQLASGSSETDENISKLHGFHRFIVRAIRDVLIAGTKQKCISSHKTVYGPRTPYGASMAGLPLVCGLFMISSSGTTRRKISPRKRKTSTKDLMDD
jgi:hypothetical protein